MPVWHFLQTGLKQIHVHKHVRYCGKTLLVQVQDTSLSELLHDIYCFTPTISCTKYLQYSKLSCIITEFGKRLTIQITHVIFVLIHKLLGLTTEFDTLKQSGYSAVQAFLRPCINSGVTWSVCSGGDIEACQAGGLPRLEQTGLPESVIYFMLVLLYGS